MFEPSVLDKLFVVLLAYGLGSLPFGLFIAGFRGVDIQEVGSGNIGATNVARAVGAPWAILTGVLDVAKGIIPVAMTMWLLPHEPFWLTAVGFAAVAGHCVSPFLGFRGGKGVATSAGVMLVVAPVPTIGAAAAWGLIMALTRVSSLSALVALPVLLILLMLVQPSQMSQWLPLLLLLGALIVWRHRGNVGRLRRGQEFRFSD